MDCQVAVKRGNDDSMDCHRRCRNCWDSSLGVVEMGCDEHRATSCDCKGSLGVHRRFVEQLVSKHVWDIAIPNGENKMEWFYYVLTALAAVIASYMLMNHALAGYVAKTS